MSQVEPRPLHSWRQGSLVERGFAIQQGWLDTGSTDDMLFVATHDCDLQSCGDGVDSVELVRCKPVAKVAGTNGAGKHPRVLHLEETMAGQTTFISLDQTQKLTVEKAKLLEGTPDHVLSHLNRKVFSRWLASRYSRSALPDSFERRLNHARTLAADKLSKPHPEKAKKDRNLAKALQSAFAEFGVPIEGIYISMAGKESDELSPSDVYSLSLVCVAVSKSGRTDEEALRDAGKLSDLIMGLFEHATWDQKVGAVDLLKCLPSIETGFSLYQQRRMLKWNLDWLTIEG